MGSKRQTRCPEIVKGMIHDKTDIDAARASTWNSLTNEKRLMKKDQKIEEHAKKVCRLREKTLAETRAATAPSRAKERTIGGSALLLTYSIARWMVWIDDNDERDKERDTTLARTCTSLALQPVTVHEEEEEEPPFNISPLDISSIIIFVCPISTA